MKLSTPMKMERPPGRSPEQVATAIADILAEAGADLVASLPDGWIAPLIKHLDHDRRSGTFRSIAKRRRSAFVRACSSAAALAWRSWARPDF